MTYRSSFGVKFTFGCHKCNKQLLKKQQVEMEANHLNVTERWKKNLVKPSETYEQGENTENR
jgi:hypothetical protein